MQWKPTVLLALTAIAFLGSMFIGRQPLARRMLGSAFEGTLQVSAREWVTINSLWVAWFALLAVANLYIARNFAESVWVHFKVYRHHRGHVPIHAPAGLLAEQQGQGPATGPGAVSSRESLLRQRLESRFTPSVLIIRTKVICTSAMPERPEATAIFA